MSEVKDAVATYEADFYAWTKEQVALLRAGRFADVDIENVAEEIESLGRGVRRELVSRLEVLLLHLLKWEFQPERRGKSWQLTIVEQREQLAKHLQENPSLRGARHEAVADAYGTALIRAARETDLPRDYFPWACKWTVEQVFDDSFWPEVD